MKAKRSKPTGQQVERMGDMAVMKKASLKHVVDLVRMAVEHDKPVVKGKRTGVAWG